MREVLFRGKRTDNGEWVEGFYVKFYSNGGSNPNYMIFTIDEQNRSSQPYTIATDTVCQYTGLTDKNGRRVFEGDIVRYIDEVIGKEKVDEVEYNETHVAFCRLHKSEMGLQYLWLDEAVANKCEVIGDIFDNLELLEGGRS